MTTFEVPHLSDLELMNLLDELIGLISSGLKVKFTFAVETFNQLNGFFLFLSYLLIKNFLHLVKPIDNFPLNFGVDRLVILQVFLHGQLSVIFPFFDLSIGQQLPYNRRILFF